MRECHKQTFLNKGDADKQARLSAKTMRQRGRYKGKLIAYECQNCHLYHLTSEKQRK